MVNQKNEKHPVEKILDIASRWISHNLVPNLIEKKTYCCECNEYIDEGHHEGCKVKEMQDALAELNNTQDTKEKIKELKEALDCNRWPKMSNTDRSQIYTIYRVICEKNLPVAKTNIALTEYLYAKYIVFDSHLGS